MFKTFLFVFIIIYIFQITFICIGIIEDAIESRKELLQLMIPYFPCFILYALYISLISLIINFKRLKI